MRQGSQAKQGHVAPQQTGIHTHLSCQAAGDGTAPAPYRCAHSSKTPMRNGCAEARLPTSSRTVFYALLWLLAATITRLTPVF